jgi:hypothetical protein
MLLSLLTMLYLSVGSESSVIDLGEDIMMSGWSGRVQRLEKLYSYAGWLLRQSLIDQRGE